MIGLLAIEPVEGGNPDNLAFKVEIDVEPSGITAHCSCPYDWGGYCKHIGAVLLTLAFVINLYLTRLQQGAAKR